MSALRCYRAAQTALEQHGCAGRALHDKFSGPMAACDRMPELVPLNVGRHALILLLLSQQKEPISSFRESTLFLVIPPVEAKHEHTVGARSNRMRSNVGVVNIDSGVGQAGPGTTTIAVVQARDCLNTPSTRVAHVLTHN